MWDFLNYYSSFDPPTSKEHLVSREESTRRILRDKLINEFCMKKPIYWDDIPYSGKLPDPVMDYLEKLEVVVVTYPETSPMCDFLPGGKEHLEFIIRREIEGHTPEVYYTNTGGYPYMRYAFKFHPRS